MAHRKSPVRVDRSDVFLIVGIVQMSIGTIDRKQPCIDSINSDATPMVDIKNTTTFFSDKHIDLKYLRYDIIRSHKNCCKYDKLQD